MKIKTITSIVIGLGLIAYLITPYYSTWRMMQAVQSGSAEEMRRYIDFPKVQSSIKQQIDTAFEQEMSRGDPMVIMMANAFRPMFDEIVDELVNPDKLAELINSGKLTKQRKTEKTDTKPGADIENKKLSTESESLTWYAFFDRPNRFRISVNNLVLYMELQDWKWQLTAIGMDNLLDTDRSRTDEKTPLIVDEIDHNSPVPPVAVIDFEALKADIAEAFFIVQDYSDYAQVEGDFYYSPITSFSSMVMSDFSPKVTWLDARDADNKQVLGEFSQKELENRKKYNWGNGFYAGQWSDKLPKKTPDNKIVSARGKCRIIVPTKIENYSLKESHRNQMQEQAQTAVTLIAMENGNIRLSYYTPHSQPKITPLIIVRNAKGQPLKQRSSMSSTPDEPVENPRFKQPMRGTTKSISIAGTPKKVDVYFPLESVAVEHEFTAMKKPEVAFGEVKTPITRTRYEKPLNEAELLVIDTKQLKKHTHVSFHEETNYDKTKSRYIKLTLPDIVNSSFARPEYDALQVIVEGQKMNFKTARNHSKINEYRVYFLDERIDKASNTPSLERLMFDRVEGILNLKYPAKFETITITQGENQNGIHLGGAILTYPKDGDIPDYSQFFDTRSVIAYGNNNKRIALLDNRSFWNKKENKLIFWGQPDYTKVKKVIQWIELKIPVDLSIKDLQVEKDKD